MRLIICTDRSVTMANFIITESNLNRIKQNPEIFSLNKYQVQQSQETGAILSAEISDS